MELGYASPKGEKSARRYITAVYRGGRGRFVLSTSERSELATVGAQVPPDALDGRHQALRMDTAAGTDAGTGGNSGQGGTRHTLGKISVRTLTPSSVAYLSEADAASNIELPCSPIVRIDYPAFEEESEMRAGRGTGPAVQHTAHIDHAALGTASIWRRSRARS